MQIRKNVFETNSSSSHTVVIQDGVDYITENFPEEIIIGTGEYGWEHEHYTDWRDKATYALTYAINYGRSEDVENLKNVMEEFTKSQVTFDLNSGDEYNINGYIDHQSVDEAETIFTSKQSIKDFIFGINSNFTTSNDND